MPKRLSLTLIILCGFLRSVAGVASPTEEVYQRGLTAYNRQDYATALREWQLLAQQGHPLAQTNLGYMYAQGRGVTRDDAEAVQWYRKAADQGDALGQANLGYMYDHGRGVAQDNVEAVQWYRKAADQGNALGQANLGAMYAQGRGVTRNDAEAVQWYRKAADQGDALGQANLGYMYDHGLGVAQDNVEAMQWYRKAAVQGNADAQNNLGYMYDHSQGVARNNVEAMQWYRKAAVQGNAAAQNNLGYMYDHGRGVTRNDAEAVQWYRKAADQGNALGQANLGAMYAQGRGVTRNDAEAVQWYRKAADQGNALGQANLGAMYAQGRGVTRDLVEAQRWYAKAAETYPPGADRDKAVQNRDRIAHQLAATQAPAPQPAPSVSSVPIITPSTPSTPAVSSSSSEQPRRALVIGNAAYPDSPLNNPVNDATDLAAVLRRFGFDVTLRQNADKPAMDRAIVDFTFGAPRGSTGLFFFAGHGVQIEGLNYLVPIGARFSAASDVKYHAVAADWVLARMDESAMDVKMLILDACRNKPLGRSWTRALSRGLGVMETPKGALIAYATSPGKTASDGPGRNSPFTAQLLRELPIPGRDIEKALKAVRAGVHLATAGQQIPWVATSMTGDFQLAR